MSFTQKNVDTSKNVESWRSMLVNVDEILKAPYIVTIKSDKTELITAINVVASQVVGFIMSLDEQQINDIPYKDSWTAAQLISHVSKSIAWMVKAISKAGNQPNREITDRIIELKQTFLDVTRTLKSPEEIVPEQKKYKKDVLFKELQYCLKQLKEATSTADVSELIKDLPLGPITKLEILHFLLYHIQRHLYQMKKIFDALKHKKK